MGLILDSSVVIDAERRDETVARLIERIIGLTKDQEAALSAVGLTELVHGIYRASTPSIRTRREAFLEDFWRISRSIRTPKRQRCWRESSTESSGTKGSLFLSPICSSARLRSQSATPS